jgi:hypothetical protein
MDWMKLTEEQILKLPTYECLMKLMMRKDEVKAANQRIKMDRQNAEANERLKNL